MLDIPEIIPRRIADRIKLEESTGCWVYYGKDPSSNGYQRCRLWGMKWQVHRLLYELITGKDIREKELDHLCENRPCCNPEHMDPVTPSINCKRKFRRRKKAPPFKTTRAIEHENRNISSHTGSCVE